MLRFLFKWTAFAALILLLGQVHVGDETIGARFQDSVIGVARWSGEKLKRSEFISHSSSGKALSEWVGSLGPKTASVGRMISHPEKPLKRAEKPTEDIPASDRESLLRLLQ